MIYIHVQPCIRSLLMLSVVFQFLKRSLLRLKTAFIMIYFTRICSLAVVDAFLNETLRCRNPVMVAIPHLAIKDTTIQVQYYNFLTLTGIFMTLSVNLFHLVTFPPPHLRNVIFSYNIATTSYEVKN